MNLIKRYFHLLPLIWVCCLFLTSHASAKTSVSDSAQLLTIEEIENITDSCDTVLERHDTSVYIVTTDKFNSRKDCRVYAEKIGKKDNAPKNLVILLVSTKKNDIICQITCFGKAKTYLTEKRCRSIEKNVAKKLTRGEYFDAFNGFSDELSTALERNPKLDAIPFRSTVQLLFSLLLSAGILFGILHTSKSRKAPYAKTNLDTAHSHLLGRLDHFLDITASK